MRSVIYMEKYVGREVDIIYMDRQGKFTRRRIRILAVQDGVMRAFDLDCRAPRVFRTENILAAQPSVVSA